MNEKTPSLLPPFAWSVAAGLLGARILIYAFTGGANPLHGDEYYFLACGQHLAWGYVDHPPLVPFLARLTDALLGTSPYAMRFVPFLAGCLSIALTMLLARELGGGLRAQGLAGLAVLVGPVFLRTGSTFCIPVVEPVFWLGATVLTVRLLRSGDARWWLAVGVVAGLGLLTKHLMLFWGAGLVLGLLATPARREFRSPWLWLGGALALAILLPHIYWQYANDWPTLEFIQAMRDAYAVHEPPAMLLPAQLLYLTPAAALLWGPGLVWGFRQLPPTLRAVAFIAPATFVLLLFTGGKPYYFAPAAPILFAFGGLFWERRAAATGKVFGLRATMAALAGFGLLLFPVASPVLPLPMATSYVKIVTGGVVPPHEILDEFHAGYGYPEQYEAALDIYSRLSPEEQAQCLYLANNFSSAGVADLLRRDTDGPPPASGHMNYFLWGLPEDRGEVAIANSYSEEVLKALYREVEVAAVVHAPLARHSEHERALYLCRGLKRDLDEVWPYFKNFNNFRAAPPGLADRLSE